MSISDSQKAILINYVSTLGHRLLNSDSQVKNHHWDIELATCNHRVNVRVDSISESRNKNKDISCPECKFILKIEKFCLNVGMSLDPDFIISTNEIQENGVKLECNSCHLHYHYTGDFRENFKCFCNMKIKQDEHVLYKHIQNAFPEAKMTKEYNYYDGHKIDICFELFGYRFLIEVDDNNHFYQTTPKFEIDKRVMNHFYNKNSPTDFFIRIHTDMVHREDILAEIIDFITYEEEGCNTFFISNGKKNRYAHLLE